MCSSSDTPAFRYFFFISFRLFKHLEWVMEEEKEKARTLWVENRAVE